eukprot:TRINITY_DN7445_c0_g2_i1.p2 TRINITY_DN7445_c0_g2~~TRINITY_DN7445_c0_g2_i1.p2  ORF type:complete len:120 (+),score=13.96 TRINITY_DN7445_c0_g2_i1:190-549(+)
MRKYGSSLAVALKGMEKARTLRIVAEKRKARLMSAPRFNFNATCNLPHRLSTCIISSQVCIRSVGRRLPRRNTPSTLYYTCTSAFGKTVDLAATSKTAGKSISPQEEKIKLLCTLIDLE